MARFTSRPAHELVESDFVACPVWRFTPEAEGEPGADESHVVPFPDGLRLGMHCSLMVRARYLLDSGQELAGAVQVDLLGRKVILTPAFLYVGGKSIDPLSADVDARVARITKLPKPRLSRWTLGEIFAGETSPRRGRINTSAWLRAAVLAARLISLRFVPRGGR